MLRTAKPDTSTPEQTFVLRSELCVCLPLISQVWCFGCVYIKTEPPPVLKPAVNVTSSVGSVAVLSCQVEGSMRHNLTWHRAGRTIWARTGRVRLLPDSSLQISGVHTQDAGQYHCIATNAHGNNKITVWLLVPGTVGQNHAGHLLKHLTHQGPHGSSMAPSSGFHYIFNLLAVRFSYFLNRKKCLISQTWCMLKSVASIVGMNSDVSNETQPNKCETCPHCSRSHDVRHKRVFGNCTTAHSIMVTVVKPVIGKL